MVQAYSETRETSSEEHQEFNMTNVIGNMRIEVVLVTAQLATTLERLQPALALCDTSRFDAIGRVQLLNSDGEIVANGAFRKREFPGDFGDAQAGRGSGKHLALAFSERIVSLAECGKRQIGINNALARHDAPDGSRQFSRRGIFEKKTDHPTFHSPAQVARTSKGGQDHHAACWHLIAQIGGSLQAILAGHLDIKQSHIRMGGLRSLHYFITTSNLRHNLNVALEHE